MHNNAEINVPRQPLSRPRYLSRENLPHHNPEAVDVARVGRSLFLQHLVAPGNDRHKRWNFEASQLAIIAITAADGHENACVCAC